LFLILFKIYKIKEFIMKKAALFLLVTAIATGFYTAVAQDLTDRYLLELKEASAKDYVQLMYEGSQESKLLAAIKLGEMGTAEEEVIDALVYGLGQGTFFVVRQYGKVSNDYWDVRAASAKALGIIGDPAPLYNLYYTLRYDPDKFVRGSAAYAIGKIGQKESVYYLKRTIQTSSTVGQDDDLILACIEALGDIGDHSGFSPLVEVLRGKYRRSVKLAAMEAIRKLNWE
jgi:HEAT repeat protein